MKSSGCVIMMRSTPRRLASFTRIQISLTCRCPVARTMPVFAMTSRTSFTSSRRVRSPFRTGTPVVARILLDEAGWTRPDVFSHWRWFSAASVGM